MVVVAEIWRWALSEGSGRGGWESIRHLPEIGVVPQHISLSVNPLSPSRAQLATILELNSPGIAN